MDGLDLFGKGEVNERAILAGGGGVDIAGETGSCKVSLRAGDGQIPPKISSSCSSDRAANAKPDEVEGRGKSEGGVQGRLAALLD